MDFLNQNIAAIIVAFVAAIPGILAYFQNMKKTEIEEDTAEVTAAKNITDAATSLLKPYRETISTLSANLDEANGVVRTLRKQNTSLTDRMINLEKENQELRQENQELRRELRGEERDDNKEGTG